MADQSGRATRTDNNNSNRGGRRGRGGRGGGNAGNSNSGRKPPVRTIPMRFKDLPKLDDAGRKKLIDERRCFRCRDQGHDRVSPLCVFAESKGLYEFGNVQQETPIQLAAASIEAALQQLLLTNGSGNAQAQT
ncbi:unnamed protein product [Zymoseptoria tritici ST99CH_3D1]|nr:unnamed protein product [Zymoseptoria tritici ST99CH_3D1]